VAAVHLVSSPALISIPRKHDLRQHFNPASSGIVPPRVARLEWHDSPPSHASLIRTVAFFREVLELKKALLAVMNRLSRTPRTTPVPSLIVKRTSRQHSSRSSSRRPITSTEFWTSCTSSVATKLLPSGNSPKNLLRSSSASQTHTSLFLKLSRCFVL
jgi:hypothetical protein